MAGTEAQSCTADTEALFRPSKRRKFYRKRDDEDVETEAVELQLPGMRSDTHRDAYVGVSEQAGSNAQTAQKEGEGRPQSMTEIFRRRKLARSRKGGIAFTDNSDRSRSGAAIPLGPFSDALVVQDDIPEEIKAVTGRFAPQTGQVADVDKHMMAFIDSEIAKRLQGITTNARAEPVVPTKSTVATAKISSERQPASMGKLHEIDLGPSTTLNNIERTAAAHKTLGSDTVDTETTQRLGKDGKPRRGQKRRTSEDIRRDRLVEEVLRESRLEIYDDPDPLAVGDGIADEEAQMGADDRIAEQFRREFMDAISSRHRKRAPAPKATVSKGGKKVEERPKGPKLGGSRSARAAMREMQEKQGKK